MVTSAFQCCICNMPLQQQHLCFDRRIESASVIVHQGKPTTSLNIAVRETLLMYCSHACWQADEANVALILQLQQTYPVFNFVTPCCRCGNPVDRTSQYVNYSISEMRADDEDAFIAYCVDDHDFAVLCPDCASPKLGEDMAQECEPEEKEGV